MVASRSLPLHTLGHEALKLPIELIRLLVIHPMPTIIHRPPRQPRLPTSLFHPSHRLLHALQRETPGSPPGHHPRWLRDQLNRLPVVIPRVIGQQSRQPRALTQPTDAGKEPLVLLRLQPAHLVAVLGHEPVAQTLLHETFVRLLGRRRPRPLGREHARLVVTPFVGPRLVPVAKQGAVLQGRLVREDEARKVGVPKQLDVGPQDGRADGAADGDELDGVRRGRGATEMGQKGAQVDGQARDVVPALAPVRGAVATHVRGDDPVVLREAGVVAGEVGGAATEAVHEDDAGAAAQVGERAWSGGGDVFQGERGLHGQGDAIIGAAVGILHASLWKEFHGEV